MYPPFLYNPEMMDQKKLEAVYLDHRQGLFTLALAITGCRAHAEDAVHDAFSKLSTAKPVGGDLVAYVYCSVRNAARDVGRRLGRGNRLSESIFNGYVPPIRAEIEDPGDQLLTRERDQIIRYAINQLPEEYREAVVMKVFSDLTFRQIGEITGHPLKTVATRYRRALDRLNESLKGQL